MYYDSTGKNKSLIYLPKEKVRYFTQCERVIFYSNMAAGETVILNTVDHNISKYYKREYTMDLLARKLKYKIALSSHRHLV